MKRLLLFTVIFFSLFACNDKPKKVIKAPSTGRFNELLVVIPQVDWMGDTGSELKKILAADVMGLPQPEPQFSIIQIEPNRFDGLIQRSRNILIINKEGESKIDIQKNVYSAPQVVITLSAESQESLLNLIEENEKGLVDTYKASDLSALRKAPANKPYHPEQFTFFKKQGLSLQVPDNFELVDDQDDFIWFRDETYDPGKDINGSKNVIAYTLPLEIPFEQIKDSIAGMRNVFGKKYIPGPKTGTHMITEAAYTPHIFLDKLNGKPAYRTLGKFEISDSFMAGPFISYTVEDKTQDRIVVVEGFVYAPLVNKRDFRFELEAIIGTLKVE
jgi:hypothetical protein